MKKFWNKPTIDFLAEAKLQDTREKKLESKLEWEDDMNVL